MTTTLNALQIELSAIQDSAALICPISGLPSPSSLPPLPAGLYFPFQHPITSLVPTLFKADPDSKHWDYLTSLSKDLRSGALLATLAHLNKVVYEDGANAYLIRLSMTNTWTTKQIDQALAFLSTRVKQSKLSFGPLALNSEDRLTPEVWDAWTSAILKLDHYTANAESRGWIIQTLEEWTDSNLENAIATSRIAKPSPTKLTKQLNAEAYDAYLEFKEWLPKRTQEKAKGIVKQLATTHLVDIVDSFLDGVAGYALGNAEAESAYQELVDAVRSTRTRASEAGLILCFDTPASPSLEVDTPKVQTETLKEKMARLRAAKGGN